MLLSRLNTAIPSVFPTVPPAFTVSINQQTLLTVRVEALIRKRERLTKCQHTHFQCLETWERPLPNSQPSQWTPSISPFFSGIHTEPVEQNRCNQDRKLGSHQNSCNLQRFWKAWLKFVPLHSYTHCTLASQDAQTTNFLNISWNLWNVLGKIQELEKYNCGASGEKKNTGNYLKEH